MNRDKRVADYLLLLYSAFSLIALSMPLTVPVQSLKACVSYILNPFPYYGAHAVERFSGVPTGVMQLISADIENRTLRDSLKRLPLVEAEAESLRRENERLKQSAGLKPAQGRVIRWAKVIERDPLNWYRYLIIDAGKDDGLEINSPVLGMMDGRLGAVGRVTEVSPQTSKVLLLSDETSSVACYIPTKQW